METPAGIFVKGVDRPGIDANSAANGLSFDAASKKIVLGNDSGDPAAPAQLQSTREILTNGFSILLTTGTMPSDKVNDISANGMEVKFNSNLASTGVEPGAILIVDQNTNRPNIEMNGGGTVLRLENNMGVISLGFQGHAIAAIQIPDTDNVLIGTNTDNQAKLQVNGIISAAMQTENLDFPNTAAQTSSDIAVVFVGALPGDVVIVGPPTGSIMADSNYWGFASNNDEVTIRFDNYSAAAQNPPAGDFNITIIKKL